MAQLYTVGYEGQEIDSFVQDLEDKGVETLIDVRELPLSRKRGFSKTRLGEALASRGIGYAHLKPLGCPKGIRQQYRTTKDWIEYTRQYQIHLEAQGETLASLLAQVEQTTCVLMCYEADAAQCHRSYVAQRLRELSGQRIVVHHLEG